ncbi:FUSC family protein [Tepidibacter aestuarii]|uniref:FUSC family protein n=1 Tax=Tepidibacter aestuarii TaxID=2925782 RepID=UPI0020C13896|nr:FUSC family protein [Tepidibacter aestuarii]CAH2215410.1 Fusaric acid resistance protein-like [Tepidibacter aestuarii]
MKINTKNKLILMRMKIFLIAIAAIIIFYIFGGENLVVGVGAVITAASMFGEDYSSDIATTTILLAIINVLIGVFAYIAGINHFLGLTFTFFTSFIIYYLFSYDAKPSKSIGFIMTYLLLIYTPVPLINMPIRLVALAFSGIVIMSLYCILSRYNFNEFINKEVINSINLMKEETDLILKGKEINDKSKLVNIKLKNIELKLYERIENSKNDLDSVYIKGIIIVLLKRINTILPLIKTKESDKLILEIIKKIFENINIYISGEDGLEILKDNLRKHYNNLEIDKIEDDLEKYNYYNLKAAIREIYKCIENMGDIRSIYMNQRIKLLKLIKDDIYGLKTNFKMTSLRFNLAIKASILISISVFIVNYFKIYEGQWAIYTIALLLLPYAEQSNKKAKDRVIGTIIGAILFNMINLIINDNVTLMIILLFIFIYASMIISPYNIKCIFITFNSILGIKIMNPNSLVFLLTGYRVIFTLAGAIVTAIIMNVFFPYKLKDDIKNTIMKYTDLNKRILNELEADNIDKNKLEIMLIVNSYLWRRINYNNKELKCNNIENLLSEQNDFITDIIFLFKTSKYIDNNVDLVKSLAKEFKTIINESDLEEKTKQIFDLSNSDAERLIVINMYKIYSGFKNIDSLCKKAIDNLSHM